MIFGHKRREMCMKILFVIPTLGTGGAERVASILANYFSNSNEVEFFVMEKSNVERYPISEKVFIKEACINVKRGNKARTIINFGFNFMSQRNKLQKEIYKLKPDVIISFLPKADILTYSVKGDYKWVASERNDPMNRSNIERTILNYIYKKTDMLVCQTKKIAYFYRKKHIKHTCVIRNPLVLNDTASVSAENKKNYVIAVGRLDKQKNYSMLIRAFSKAKKNKQIKEKLYIVGEGPQREDLQNTIDSLNLQDDVVLIGRKNNIRDYLVEAKAFILSSDYEGLPNAMLEAMDANLPIISTDYFTGAAKEFVDEKNGYIVPVGDCQEMAKAIEKLLLKSNLELKEMGYVSKQRVKTLDVVEISKQWNKMLKSISKVK